MDDEYLTVAEVADRLRTTRSAINRLIAAGALPAVRLGRRLTRIPRAPFETWLQARAIGGRDGAI